VADPRLRAVDVVGPWGDWPDFLAEAKGIPDSERQNYLKPEFLKTLETLEPVHYLPSLDPQRIRIQFTEQELKTKWAATVKNAAPQGATLRKYASAEELHNASASGDLFQWLADRLKPAAQSLSSANRGGNGASR
jgi:hypothetical protein